MFAHITPMEKVWFATWRKIQYIDILTNAVLEKKQNIFKFMPDYSHTHYIK